MTRRRYVQIDGQLIEVGLDYVPEPRTQGLQIMPDIKPYRSMIDGTMITSRSQHREHLRAHNCIEVGNDSSVLNPKPSPLRSPPGLKELYIDVANSKLRRQ